MESPPKRITRSRAAKVSEPTVKTTRIVTAAAKAKSAAPTTSNIRSTATKRKMRSDEEEGQDNQGETLAKRPTRGRPRRVAEPDGKQSETASAPARSTRTRVVKKAENETSKEAKPSVPRATRGRPKKTDTNTEQGQTVADEPPKKVTRGRAATISKPTSTTTKPGGRKTVTFQEPDKENLQPPPKAKEPTTGGLRGRPVRRGATVGSQAAKAAEMSSDRVQKKPLSPKKVTQVPVSKEDDDSSEDELAANDKTPVVALLKSPIKPPRPASSQQKEAVVEDLSGIEVAVVSTETLQAPELAAPILGSPARRPPSSPIKDTFKSPARKIGAVALPGSTMKLSGETNGQSVSATPFKSSLLQSAAKRPQSPMKGLNFGSVSKSQHSQSAMKLSMFQSPAKRAMPGFKPMAEPSGRDIPELGVLSNDKTASDTTSTPASTRPSEKLTTEDEQNVGDEDVFDGPMESLQFPGRLSAVLPRQADPALCENMKGPEDDPSIPEEPTEAIEQDPAPEVTAAQEAEHLEEEDVTKPLTDEFTQLVMVEVNGSETAPTTDMIDDVEDLVNVTTSMNTTPFQSPESTDPRLQLRTKDVDPCHNLDSDSEDEPTRVLEAPSPTPKIAVYKNADDLDESGKMHAVSKSSRRSTIGFTQLAEQLGSWSASSPVKLSKAVTPSTTPNVSEAATVMPQHDDSPLSNHFFEDEMVIRPDSVPLEHGSDMDQTCDIDEVDIDEPMMDDIMVTEEDMALAVEANEMSHMEPEEVEEIVGHHESFSDSVSDASQEYGDENQVPIDPAIMAVASPSPKTPVRPMMKVFHTTTKVPLKPADDSTPSPLKKRSFSASRVAPKRPTGMTRSATVISYSPVKKNGSVDARLENRPAVVVEPCTPAKADMWSIMGTPARTPRRDVDASLLRGAVVYVDVHTSEGADASGIFVELLGQMGARCVKSWNWNPTGSDDDDESSSSKIGITHVVYKDGGKRTLERVRQANGVVHCVGVSWVLDCERENEWLDEGAYHVDTRTVPRGGGRRRKSMEPKALANQNSTLVSSPIKRSGNSRNSQSAPNTPLNRRDSTAWMHTPSDQAEQDQDNGDWAEGFLTPVPKTPAPETIARYADEILDTPSMYDGEPESPTRETLMMRTCPAPNKYRDMGADVLRRDKDEGVLMRLMAARRKSLQFAPKIASPLSKTWE
ncbi:hypothetical protein S40293_02366 [Stachybotrys chartarum IBT 40293]|nr:hypothetical protein S40293_02366 [Stachybotrys chartarum IBT 40293]